MKAKGVKALALAFVASAFVAACSSGGGKSADAGGDAREDAAAPPDGGDEPIADAQPVETDADGAADGDASATDALGDAGDVSTDGVSGDGGGDAGSIDAAGDGGGDAGGADAALAPPCPTCRLYPLFAPLGVNSQQLAPGVIRFLDIIGITLVNGSNARAPLDKVEVRYWFTANGASGLNGGCGGNCGRLAGAVLHPTGPRPGADNYMALTFQSGVLDAFSDTGLIQLTLVGDANLLIGQPAFIPDDDYSFVNDGQPDQRITIYDNGKLVWGTEPM